MVNVEADVLCGPLLAAKARERNLVYSMAYGDQPAIICEMIDWARACGFDLAAAGKGMKFEPHYRYSTPDTVWKYFGWSKEEVAEGDFNAKLFNSFTDGTKSAIEMVAVSNASGLDCPGDGLAFLPSGTGDLANVFRPASEGGRLERCGLVEIASSPVFEWNRARGPLALRRVRNIPRPITIMLATVFGSTDSRPTIPAGSPPCGDPST